MKNIFVLAMIGIAFLLLAPAVYATSGTTQETSSQTVEAGIVPELVLTPPGSSTFTDFVVGTNTPSTIGSVNTKSNRVYQIQIKANSTVMAPWNYGSGAWGTGSALTGVFSWRQSTTGGAYTAIATTDQVAKSNATVTAQGGDDTPFAIKQVIGYNDKSYTVGEQTTYRIILTYTAIQTP